MADLRITATNPTVDENNVPINTVIWVNFNADLNWDSNLSIFWLLVFEDDADMTQVSGTVTRSTNKERLIFTPDTNLKANTRYKVTVYGSTTGPTSGSGSDLIYMNDHYIYDFTTGSTETAETDTGDAVADQAPATSGTVSVSTYLQVSSTSPEDNETNVDRATSSMYIKFNELPSNPDDGWEDTITITRKGVLGE